MEPRQHGDSVSTAESISTTESIPTAEQLPTIKNKVTRRSLLRAAVATTGAVIIWQFARTFLIECTIEDAGLSTNNDFIEINEVIENKIFIEIKTTITAEIIVGGEKLWENRREISISANNRISERHIIPINDFNSEQVNMIESGEYRIEYIINGIRTAATYEG